MADLFIPLLLIKDDIATSVGILLIGIVEVIDGGYINFKFYVPCKKEILYV